MKLMITGANGFIGNAMVRELSKRHFVYAVVRRPESCLNIDNVEYVPHDFAANLERTKFPQKIDTLVHLAQSSQYRNFPEGMRDMVDVNISGLADILEYARLAECNHFINFSSGSIYSANPLEQTETAQVSPEQAYPVTKYISEQLTDLYLPFFATLNLRLFFPYGPGQKGMLIPNLIDSVQRGKPIKLQGQSGGLKICPIFIDDVVRVTNLCMEKKTSGLINVAGNQTISLQAIVEHIAAETLCKPLFETDTGSPAAKFTPSLQLMNNLLNGTELTPFEDGIRQTINY